jgi:hypothetical protein
MRSEFIALWNILSCKAEIQYSPLPPPATQNNMRYLECTNVQSHVLKRYGTIDVISKS